VKTDIVACDVLVTDPKQNLIAGLTKNDFVVTEDGSPQLIETFSYGERVSIPRSIVLILGRGDIEAPYLKNSINAARILADKLGPDDKLAIVTTDLQVRLEFTKDKTLIKRTLDSLERPDPPHGSGMEFSTLMAVLNEMFSKDDRSRTVISQGAGVEAIWLKPDKDAPFRVSYSTRYDSEMKWVGETEAMQTFGFDDVQEVVQGSETTIYSLIPGPRFLGRSQKEQLALAKITLTDWIKFFNDKSDIAWVVRNLSYVEIERRTAEQIAMSKVAEISGGIAGFIEKPEDAENAYSDIFKIIQNRYVIGYYPTNERRDGKLRQIKIEVRGHPEYIVTGRKAYYAPQQ
jgi:VWFA-related protein